VEAAHLADEGKKEEAKSRLHEILHFPHLETRMQLLVWSALRELGEQPDEKLGMEVLGVVLEIPMQTGYDTLAAYQDGSARYLNYSGGAFLWDAPDATIQSWCDRLRTAAVSASSRATPRRSVSLPKSGIQATLLTRSGNYVIPHPPVPVITAGVSLMRELMSRTKEKKE
jgi:hypothetical protein